MKEDNNKVNISRRGFLKTAALSSWRLRFGGAIWQILCKHSCSGTAVK